MATAQEKAAQEQAQRTKPADEVETKSEADARESAADGGKRKGGMSREDATEQVRARRAREFRRNPVDIVPGAAGDPLEPEGSDMSDLVDDGDDAVVTLDEYVDMPSSAAPGTGPFDTQDPLEHASSVTPFKGDAARRGFGTVNAVVPIPDPSGVERGEVDRAMAAGAHRIEQYQVRQDNGAYATVEHNIDTGETKVLSRA